MLTTYPHPCLRRVEWVSDLVLSLRGGVARWVITPGEIALLDDIGLRWFVSRGHWPAKFGEPASLWLADAGSELVTSDDGVHWRKLWLPPDALDPTAVAETGAVVTFAAALPSISDDAAEWWLALIAPGGSPSVVASGTTTPRTVDAPHAHPASG